MKNRLWWVLYDGLNSIVIITGAVYFTRWMIADAGVSDTAVAITTSLASLAFILLSTSFGNRLTTERATFRALLLMTLLVGILATALGIPGLVEEPSYFLLVSSLIVFFLLNIVYQLSLVAYNSYLPRIVDRTSVRRYSGIGESAGQIGSVVGLLIAVSLLGRTWFAEESIRLFLFIGPPVLVLCLASILLMRYRGERGISEQPQHADVVSLRSSVSSLLRHKVFGLLILVVFLYNNTFATLQVFSSSYLAVAAGWDERTVGVGILVTLIGAAVGGLLGGSFKGRLTLGSLLLLGLLVFGVSISGLAALGSQPAVFVSLLGGGVGFGLLAAVARACIVLLAPQLPHGFKFGVYGAVSRTAAVIGPLLWAGALALSADLGAALSRQIGMATIAIVVWIAFFVCLLSPLRKLGKEAAYASGSSDV